jgi:aminomethyltransferase
MSDLRRTVFSSRHAALGAKLAEFGGWEMPMWYQGIVEEHLAMRKSAGLFDVSHMGRLTVRGARALEFLQHVLTNNAAALAVGQAQYTIIANEQGGAVDDAYLYRFVEDEYLLVVNASNRDKDVAHLRGHLARFAGVEMIDRTEEVAMLSLQGPRSEEMLAGLIEGQLPAPKKNALGAAKIKGKPVRLARTGYTGEPLGFELFIARADALEIFDLLGGLGARPVGLGARDTLRLEAGLPLYGHELGTDAQGQEIPVFAIPLARFAVSFSPLKGEFVGRAALAKQHEAAVRIGRGDFSALDPLPRRVMAVAIAGKSIARVGARVLGPDGRPVGYVTSGTVVPYWKIEGEGPASRIGDEKLMRSLALALVDSTLRTGDSLTVEIRDKKAAGRIVSAHLQTRVPPYARPIVCEF